MNIFADLHIHSKYAYATSRDISLESLSRWAGIKGIGLLSAGDWTQPLWRAELKKKLAETGEGTYIFNGCRFLLGTEVSNIYRKNDRTRKIHNLIFAPDFRRVEALTRLFERHGKIALDGRPILKLDCEEMVRIVRDVSPECMVIPSHAWTPHFGVFGSASGFDSLEECFGDQTPHIHAIETGLSSDPAMNWRCSALDRITLISNSDAHSAPNIGREANLFDIADPDNAYPEVKDILESKDRKRFKYTVEFFPEEGKYHLDGCRQCSERMTPAATRRNKGRCPDCGRKATVGVLNRVETLADRPEGARPRAAIPFTKVLSLKEVIGEALAVGKNSAKVGAVYDTLVREFGNELNVLLEVAPGEISRHAPERVAAGIRRMREGDIDIQPGYDGEYGTVRIRW